MRRVFLTVIFLLVCVSLFEFIFIMWGYNFIASTHPYVLYDLQANPKVIVIDVRGDIVSSASGVDYSPYSKNSIHTSAENLKKWLEYFEGDKSVKAFILDIDSHGGETWAGEEIVRSLKRSNKTSVAVIRGYGTSTAYEVASGTDRIFASAQSQVGSIGIIWTADRIRNGTEYFCEVASTTIKGMELNDCPGFSEEELFSMKIRAVESHNAFVREIAENRGVKPVDIAKYADGSIYTGEQALQYGLVDELGDLTDAVNWLEKKEGTKLKLVYLSMLLASPHEM